MAKRGFFVRRKRKIKNKKFMGLWIFALMLATALFTVWGFTVLRYRETLARNIELKAQYEELARKIEEERQINEDLIQRSREGISPYYGHSDNFSQSF